MHVLRLSNSPCSGGSGPIESYVSTLEPDRSSPRRCLQRSACTLADAYASLLLRSGRIIHSSVFLVLEHTADTACQPIRMPTKAESLWDACITTLNTLVQHTQGSPGYETALNKHSKAVTSLEKASHTAYKAAEWEKIVKQLKVRCLLATLGVRRIAQCQCTRRSSAAKCAV